jgi:hypothetical protein
MIIRNKPEYYKLAETYKFGNRFRTWDGIDEWKCSGYNGPIRFRSKVPGSKVFTTHAPFVGRSNVVRAYQNLLKNGSHAGDIIFCEPAPEQYLTFQGEVCELPGQGLYLRWSTELDLTNREAMSRPTGNHVGLAARILLREYLDPPDHDDLWEILDTWPEHVVEFSTYSIKVGVFGRRTVIWEVRKY